MALVDKAGPPLLSLACFRRPPRHQHFRLAVRPTGLPLILDISFLVFVHLPPLKFLLVFAICVADQFCKDQAVWDGHVALGCTLNILKGQSNTSLGQELLFLQVASVRGIELKQPVVFPGLSQEH